MLLQPVETNRRDKRRGLTLIELLVVLVVLAALATMVVPKLSGMANQASAATSATIISDTNTAIQSFGAKYQKEPSAWDSLLQSDDAINPKLHADLQAMLRVVALDASQATSLTSAGIVGFHDADPARTTAMPSDNSTVYRSIASGKNVAMLVETPIGTGGHGSTTIDKALNLNEKGSGSPKFTNYDYLAIGLGGPTSIKGTTMSEIPLVVTPKINPMNNYCRVICVYKVPAAGATTFPAQYVGAFLPDGTSQRDSMDKYHQSQTN